jgi:ABC-2 type transport system permease protein
VSEPGGASKAPRGERAALRAEWAKAWSDPATAWLLSALVVLSVAVSLITIGTSRCQAGCGQDPARISLAGIYLGQAVAALAGVLAIGSEYGTGMIRVTLTAMPRRGRLLAAKAVVLAGPVLAASALAVAVSMLAGRLILPGHGFTAARGFDLAGGAMWRAAFCAVVYLTLVAVLGLGLAAAVRDSAAATGIVLGLLYLFPVAARLVASQAIQQRLQQVGPMSAGLDSQATTGLHGLPLAPWPGLGVVALWAAGALVLGGVVLRLRDA